MVMFLAIMYPVTSFYAKVLVRVMRLCGVGPNTSAPYASELKDALFSSLTHSLQFQNSLQVPVSSLIERIVRRGPLIEVITQPKMCSLMPSYFDMYLATCRES